MGKTSRKLKRISPVRLEAIGLQIESLLAGEMKSVSRFYVGKYHPMLRETLGYTAEDILQEIRIVIWRGIATYNPKMSKLKTYLCNLLRRRFHNLAIRKNRKKRGRLIPVEKLSQDQQPVDQHNNETWLDYLEQFQNIVDTLDKSEMNVLKWHLKGYTLDEICRKTNQRRVNVIKNLKTIKTRMEVLRNGANNETPVNPASR
jgi:RNA polymerase sigma factor (sigma-70 family)